MPLPLLISLKNLSLIMTSGIVFADSEVPSITSLTLYGNVDVSGTSNPDQYYIKARIEDWESQPVEIGEFKTSMFHGLFVDPPTEYIGKTIIISTGASAKLLGLESEKKLMGHGVSACATCDAFFFKDKKVFVVGGGDSAMEEALFLTKFASSVTILHRRDKFRASKIMQDKELKNDKIDVMWNSTVVEMLGEPDQGGLKSVKINNTITNKEVVVSCDGLFLGIGHKPNSNIFSHINIP